MIGRSKSSTKLMPMMIVLLLAIPSLIVFCAAKTSTPPSRKSKTVRGPAQSERFLVAGADEVWLLTRTLPQGKWVRQIVKGIKIPAKYPELSVPVISLNDNIILCQTSFGNNLKGPESAQYRLYKLDERAGGLLQKRVFREESVEDTLMSKAWTLQCWLSAERKILFSFHSGEGFAGTGLLRLLNAQHAISMDEDAEIERLSKALGGEYNAISYTPDGKLLVMGYYKRVAILNRVTKHIKIAKASATFFWALSVAADNRTIAWQGETTPRKEDLAETKEEQVIDYFPVVDHVGIIDMPSGVSKTWSINTMKGIDPGQAPNQMWARIAYSTKSKNLYFTWHSDYGTLLVCFDPSRKTASVIDRDGGMFTLIAEK